MLDIWSIGPFFSPSVSIHLPKPVFVGHYRGRACWSIKYLLTIVQICSPWHHVALQYVHLLLLRDCFERLASCTESGSCLLPLRFAFNYFLPLVDYDKVACERMQGAVYSSFCIQAAVLLINLSLTHTSKCMHTKAARGSEGQQCR